MLRHSAMDSTLHRSARFEVFAVFIVIPFLLFNNFGLFLRLRVPYKWISFILPRIKEGPTARSRP
ncbi:MAG: hypothetical protein PT965_02220, partial [Clostridia bacterium]|nr:hypothetical protein [Clostridia bacterium]MDY2930418.1 hypothetical protein [Clostridiaceae bacterium]